VVAAATAKQGVLQMERRVPPLPEVEDIASLQDTLSAKQKFSAGVFLPVCKERR